MSRILEKLVALGALALVKPRDDWGEDDRTERRAPIDPDEFDT